MSFNDDADIVEIDSKMCARNAIVFLQQGEQLLREMNHNTVSFLYYYMAPCTVELALSCELFIKAIIAIDNNGNIRRGHCINNLYKQLSKKRKDCIREKYKGYISNHSEIKSLVELEKCLKIHNNAFVEWRYYFEKGKKNSVEPSSLYFLALSLHDVYKMISDSHS